MRYFGASATRSELLFVAADPALLGLGTVLAGAN